jgi:hypothetical protein
MNVGYYLVGEHPAWLVGFLEALRSSLADPVIVQFTDEQTLVPAGVIAQRLPAAPLSLHRARHFAICGGEWLFLDTDAIVRRDLSEVFLDPFDVAVTDRLWSLYRDRYRTGGQPEFVMRYPYNAGVIFSRNTDIWRRAAEELERWPEMAASWTGDQEMLNTLARSGRYAVRVLPGQNYNFPPDDLFEAERGNAAILHFKGKQRKPLLEEYLHKRAACV